MSGLAIVVALVILALAVAWLRRSASARPAINSAEAEQWGDDLASDEFPLSVVGESYKNKDGTARQSIIRRCSPGDPVSLVPEPDNPKDRFAVAVVHRLGQIGYLPSGSGRVADDMASGKFLSVTILSIHGGDRGRPSRGVSLRVKKAPPKPRQRRKKNGRETPEARV
jgi:hypothetical protein